MTNTVTLVPLKKLVLSSPLQLVINASLLTDARGRPLDGNDDGQAGGNFLATLSKSGVSVARQCHAKCQAPLRAGRRYPVERRFSPIGDARS